MRSSTYPPSDGAAPEPGDKAGWRTWARSQLSSADAVERSARAERVVGHLRRWLAEQVPTLVVGYLALGDEVPLHQVVETDRRHRWALVRVEPGSAVLTVRAWHGPRERHRLGMAQPAEVAEVIDTTGIGVVLVPGLAFDRSGTRLGRGGGYYDRFLDTLRGRAEPPLLVGVTTSARIVTTLPRERHDVGMDRLVDEDGVHLVGTSPPIRVTGPAGTSGAGP